MHVRPRSIVRRMPLWVHDGRVLPRMAVLFKTGVGSFDAETEQRKNAFSGSVHSRRQMSFMMQLRQGRRISIAFLHVEWRLRRTSASSKSQRCCDCPPMSYR